MIIFQATFDAGVSETIQVANVRGTSALGTILIQSIAVNVPFTIVAALPNFSIVSTCVSHSNLLYVK
jgi:hypothetical protein